MKGRGGSSGLAISSTNVLVGESAMGKFICSVKSLMTVRRLYIVAFVSISEHWYTYPILSRGLSDVPDIDQP